MPGLYMEYGCTTVINTEKKTMSKAACGCDLGSRWNFQHAAIPVSMLRRSYGDCILAHASSPCAGSTA